MALMTRRKMQEQAALLPNEARDHRPQAAIYLALAFVVGAALLWATGSALAATYKWVDEKGVVHYSDKMPPEAVDKANVQLNQQGIPVKKTEKALTPEQRRANEQEIERAREVARAQEEVARRDRALVSSYANEAEIDLARNRSLQTINNAILSSQAFSDQLMKRKSDVEAKKVESQGKAIVAVLDRELESIDAELARQSELVAQKNKEVAAITAKYDADKQRWRELSATKATTKPATPVTGATATAVPAKSATPATGGTTTAIPAKSTTAANGDGTPVVPVTGTAKK
jgi:hypothetical protein